MISKYIVFDTETTGLPTHDWKDYSNARLVQLAWIVVNGSMIVKKQSYIIHDPSYKSCQESLSIHHITEEIRESLGINCDMVINEFLADCQTVNAIVAHGISFDLGIILNECTERNISPKSILNLQVVNTKLSTHYVNKHMNLEQTVSLIDKSYKPPTNTHAHDALYDVYLCNFLFTHSDNIPVHDITRYTRFWPICGCKHHTAKTTGKYDKGKHAKGVNKNKRFK